MPRHLVVTDAIEPYTFTYSGVLTPTVGAIGLPLAFNALVETVDARLGTAPVGADLVLDILSNGVSLYSTKPKFVDGSQVLTAGTLTTGITGSPILSGTALTVDVVSIGTTTPGSNLGLVIRLRRLDA